MRSNLENRPYSQVTDMLESVAKKHDLLLSQNLIDFADDVWKLAQEDKLTDRQVVAEGGTL